MKLFKFWRLQKILYASGIEFEKGVSLRNYSAIRIGGRARIMAFPKNVSELKVVAAASRRLKIRRFVLGGGSNVLFSSSGFNGVIVKLSGDFEKFSFNKNTAIAGAAAVLPQVAGVALKRGLFGLHFAHQIPATVGGAVCSNAGAGGADMSGVVESVVVLNNSLQEEVLPFASLKFAYRNSRFKKEAGKQEIILFVNFKFTEKPPAEIEAEIEKLREARAAAQPRGLSLGSVFKNGKRKNGKPYSAGAIIEQLGLKGMKRGGAVISEKHANFILNTGKAHSRHVLYLINHAKKLAKKQFNVILHEEIIILK